MSERNFWILWYRRAKQKNISKQVFARIFFIDQLTEEEESEPRCYRCAHFMEPELDGKLKQLLLNGFIP